MGNARAFARQPSLSGFGKLSWAGKLEEGHQSTRSLLSQQWGRTSEIGYLTRWELQQVFGAEGFLWHLAALQVLPAFRTFRLPPPHCTQRRSQTSFSEKASMRQISWLAACKDLGWSLFFGTMNSDQLLKEEHLVRGSQTPTVVDDVGACRCSFFVCPQILRLCFIDCNQFVPLKIHIDDVK